MFSNLRNKGLALWILVFLTAHPTQSWAWGKTGHQLVELVASRLLPQSNIKDLIQNNMDATYYLCFVPDIPWKHGSEPPHPLEGQSHFFTMDIYSPSGQPIPYEFPLFAKKFGIDKVLKYGTAPWRAEQLTALLIKAMARPNPSTIEILQIAATMGHYVSDLGNPLHVVSDYNGVKAGAPGLHSFFETKTVEDLNYNVLAGEIRDAGEKLLPKIPNETTPVEGGFYMARAGFAESKTLLDAAHKLGLSPALARLSHPIIVRTLANSSAMLAKIWYQAWVAAGKPNFRTDHLANVPTPDWIPLNYLNPGQ